MQFEPETPAPERKVSKEFIRKMTLDQISLINPSNKLQRKLEFFGIEDKNPK